jgi:hypothetical protein
MYHNIPMKEGSIETFEINEKQLWTTRSHLNCITQVHWSCKILYFNQLRISKYQIFLPVRPFIFLNWQFLCKFTFAIFIYKMHFQQAREIGREDENRLLKTKKLVLLVDLDQTLIHTTNDSIPANLKVRSNFLGGSLIQYGSTHLIPKPHLWCND